MSLKNTVKKFVETTSKKELTTDEFKSELLKQFPELNNLDTFDYYSVKYAKDFGYFFPDCVKIKDAVNEIVNSINPNLDIDEVKHTILSKYPHLNELSNFDFSLKKYAKQFGYTFKLNNSNVRTNIGLTIDETKRTDVKIETVTTENINRNNLKTYKTNTAIDDLFSDFGGVMGGTQYEVSAPAGTGKTTLLAQIAQDLKANNPGYKPLFISAEMDREDWEIEVYKNSSLSGLETLFLLNLDEDEYDIKGVLLNALKSGDFIILDSSSSIIDLLRDKETVSRGQIERWLRKNIIDISKENRSTIMTIKHVNKDGKTEGSTKDKHYFTGKMELDIDKSGDRFVFFSKNRRGGKNQNRKLFFSRNDDGKLVFNRMKFDDDTQMNEIVEVTRKNNEKSNEDFSNVFKSRLEVLDNA